jgi:predicted metal-dependent enzyme (double-stranded beta helix superfamily)
MLTSTLSPRRNRLGSDALADIAGAVVAARSIWEGVARFDPDVRRPVRLIADTVFEAWVIGWFAGQGLDLHDHGDSAGAIVVAEGRLHETTLGANGLEVHALNRGIVRRLPPKTVHSIANVDARAATSIHVYSPPLERMTHFDESDLRPVRTVEVALESPMLPTAVAQLVRIAHRI